ncbi:hypothetical protein AA0535_0888 [Asaia krungthepensis NRIC 0535]|uniref:Uncharacterized protein n=1 Tax=Asaia krungthepensis NRIC 0535 TaxID=1307925 RepID=A0ABQ0Q073_9PROT|nr:hypothetical protein AA0535_0888 [Asaia krungthepensis NRIC 0535]
MENNRKSDKSNAVCLWQSCKIQIENIICIDSLYFHGDNSSVDCVIGIVAASATADKDRSRT